MKTVKTTIMKNNLFKVAFLATAAVFISCEDDDPVSINEEEVITTVEYELVNNADANDIVTLLSTDNDGDGPNLPVVTVSGPFTAGAVYSGDVEFLNETETPAEDITEEVEEEGDEHEVFYIVNAADISIAKTDTDDDGNPLGLVTTLTAGTAGAGTLTIVLRHEPNKPNNGTLTDAGGETDVQVEFDVTVQ